MECLDADALLQQLTKAAEPKERAAVGPGRIVRVVYNGCLYGVPGHIE
jgi:hypothetical protein